MQQKLGKTIKRTAKTIILISAIICFILLGSQLFLYAFILLILIVVGLIPLYMTGIVIEKLEQVEAQNRAILELLEKQAPSDKQS